jgi:serine/threonine-protein kinase
MMPAAHHPALSNVDDARFGKYRLLGELAHGGMARIYLASMDGPGGFVKPCVIKKVLPKLMPLGDFSRMFVNEARVAALLSHPNIVQAFDFGQVGSEYYLAMEWVEGASLAMLLRESTKRKIFPSLNVTLHIGIAMCEALAYAHAARGQGGEFLGIVHRDVTPGNILLSASGGVKLTDFGIVRSAIGAVSSRPDVLKGKAAYMSPEQARCEQLDGRSDIYSLALVLYELATGERPLQRASLPESLAAAAAPEIPPPSQLAEVPERLDRMLMRALSPDPRLRYPNAKAFQIDMESFRTEQQWTSAADELGLLLRTLFPQGMPTKIPTVTLGEPAPAPTELLDATSMERLSGAGPGEGESDLDSGAPSPTPQRGAMIPVDKERGEIWEQSRERELQAQQRRHSLPELWGLDWKEVLVAAALAMVASASFWLFALP